METESTLLSDYVGQLDTGNVSYFKKIDKDFMDRLGELKTARAEFDAYRHAWAEMAANNNPPGRDSELRKRMEVMQGWAIGNLRRVMAEIERKLDGKT